MYQKDYILRMIEMLGELIAGILGLIKKGEFGKASEQISKIYYDILREDASFFRGIPERELTHKLLHEHNYTNGHLEVLGELFNIEAVLCFSQGDKSGCAEYSRKALILFEFIDSEQKTYSLERLNKMESIRKRLDEITS